MAYEVKRINPLDIDPNRGIGIGLNFKNAGVFTTTYTTIQATKTNLINYILTGKGERFMNPNLGLGLQNFLFEQLDDITTNSIEETIQAGIQTLFPTVKIIDLEVLKVLETQQISIKLNFSIAGELDSINITIG